MEWGSFFGGSFAFPHTDVAEGLGEGEGEVCESEEGEGREGGRLGGGEKGWGQGG